MSDLTEFLCGLGLGQYAPRFLENEIDISLLSELTDRDLQDLGLALIGHRRKLMRAIAAREPATTNPPEVVGETGPTDHRRIAESAPAVAAREAERRHLTVMFCDLVGSTALAARLDPEDMREIVRAYQGACAQVIGRYDGFLAQYLGDGVMAYFGYPQAHEDDAERAVRASLDLIDAVKELDTKAKVEVRVGIATGVEVVGDLIGEHGARERAVTGETPNLAARLQGLAAPGTIVVSAATRQLLGGQFALRDLGAQSVKGLDAPVTAFAVQGVHSFESRFEARAGGLTGFVGREEEREHLLARKKLAWQGRGQVVVLSGEAGIGKSRLTAWLADKIGAEPHKRLRYQCTPHHKDSALYPTIVQIERAAGIEANESADTRLGKLAALLDLAKVDQRESVPLFAALLKIPIADKYAPLAMSPGQQRQRTLAAMLDQIEGLARQKPLLMLYEDAHWADATSLELLDLLVERVARLPVLCVVTGRPEFQPSWAGRHNVSTLTLQKLAKCDARAMVESVSGGALLPAEVLEQIIAKTDGVPLFVEELTKTVIESGALAAEEPSGHAADPRPALAIPATLQDSLMARLDRSNPVKEIAQIGAAIGREFSYKILLSVAGMDEISVRTGLAKLEETELATRRGVPPDATYTFKHALVQDAAYESLLKSRRQTIHRRIAKALRDHFPVQAETEPEIVAHHFAQAGRGDAAVAWGTKAGELATERSAFVEAISHFQKAIKLADGLPDDPARRPPRLRLQTAYAHAMRAVQGYGSLDATAAFARTAELAGQLNDPSEQCTAIHGMTSGSHTRGEVLRTRDLAESMLRLAETLPTRREAAVARGALGIAMWCQGDFVEAVPNLERALAGYDEDWDMPSAVRFSHDDAVSAMIYSALTLWPLGQVDRARELAERALEHATRVRQVATMAYVHFHKGMYEVMCGNVEGPEPHARALVEIGREHELPVWRSAGGLFCAWAPWHVGERPDGWERPFTNPSIRRDQRATFASPLFAAYAADALSGGRSEIAARILASMIDENAATGLRWGDAELHRQRGRLLLAASAPDVTGAETALLQALSIARDQQARSFELRAALDLARLYGDMDRLREARDLLTAALVGFIETPELPEIAEAQRLLASPKDSLEDNRIEFSAAAAVRSHLISKRLSSGGP